VSGTSDRKTGAPIVGLNDSRTLDLLREHVRDDHAVDTAGGRGSGRVQIGIAIDPHKTQVVMVTAGGGQEANHLRAIAAKDQHQGAALHG